MKFSFTEHPASVGETYGEHLRSASGFSVKMIGGGLACLIHAIFPFLFLTTGSATIRELYQRMVANRTRMPEGARQKAEATGEI